MRYRSIGALFGLRILLVANIVLVTVTGALCFVYYERPEAYLFSGAAWCLALVLVWLIRFTDPYRRPPSRRLAKSPVHAAGGHRHVGPDAGTAHFRQE